MLSQRRAGVLLHPTSLPSGRLGQDVEQWLGFLRQAGVGVWQMLPLVIPDHTGSPYQSCSAFAMNPALLDSADCKLPDARALQSFREAQGHWLDDFALFQVLKQQQGGAAWLDWPDAYRNREPAALAEFAQAHASAIEQVVIEQCCLEQRWQAIRQLASKQQIALFGDMPIFVALDSADVWANQQEFLLDEQGQPSYVAGVPPDYFSELGQRWGNPHYNWAVMQANDFAWWKARLRRQLECFDIVRLDHFRGLVASWMIPAQSETAVEGFWQATPGEALLSALRSDYPDLPIVAEDLGIITPEVTALRKQFALPGMAVLQFAFDGFDDNPHKPKNMGPDTVAYTGTHDNDTTLGWFETLNMDTRAFVFDMLNAEPTENIAQLMIQRLLETPANLAMVPLQDILALGPDARMNTPGETEHNWQWQFDWSQLQDGVAQSLLEKIKNTGRFHDI